MSDIAHNETKFFEWLTKSSLSDEKESIDKSYKNVNLLLANNHLVKKTVFEIDSEEELSALLRKVRRSFNNKKILSAASQLITSYMDFLKEGNGIKNLGDSASDAPILDYQTELIALIEPIVLNSGLNGISIDGLSSELPMVSMTDLKSALEASDKIIDYYGVEIHSDSIIGLDEAAPQFQTIIDRLLMQNDGYTSAAQLYDYVSIEMQMFLNDNDLFDRDKIYCIAKYLFDKIDWQGAHYEFSLGRHISRDGNDSLKSNMDVFEKFAADQGGIFRWDDLLKFLNKIGIKPNNLRVQMQIGKEPIFFYYSSDELITAKSMCIDENWLGTAQMALAQLFEDVGDHIVIRDISSSWFNLLPDLPLGRPWSPLLLQYVLQFYGKELGARTIHTEIAQYYYTLHSLLVSESSEISDFGDAVITYLFDNAISQRNFREEELRKLLSAGHLIGKRELINNIPRAIGPDPRFAWDSAEENVFIKA